MKKRVAAWILVLVHLSSLVAGRAWAFDFDYYVNRVGRAQTDGRLVIWMANRWTIPLAATDEPMAFHFCYESAQQEVKDGVLGAGWWVPLLESHIDTVPLPKGKGTYYYRVTEFGSRYRFMDEVKGKPAHFSSKDGDWQCEEKEGAVIEVKGPEGWHMTYKDGWIQSAVTPGHMELAWARNEQGRVTAITAAPGQPILQATYDETGHMTELVTSNGMRFEFKMAPHPKVEMKDGKAVPAPDVPSAQFMSVNDGTFAELKVTSDKPGLFKMAFSFQQPGRASIQDRIQWQAASGHLVSDKEARYDIIRHPKGGFFPEVRRILPDGRYESYWHNTASNTTSYVDLDGTKEEARFSKTDVSHKKIEEHVSTTADGIEEWTFYEYREDGTLKLTTKFPADGGAPAVTDFDEKGRFIRRK